MVIKMKTKILIGCAVVLLVSAGVTVYYWHEENRPRIFEMYIFNLKSGHSIFIRTPDDKRILIDGGANSEIIRRITDILPFYSRKIDAIVATDTIGKNVTGLIDILNRYPVSQVYVPAITLQSIGLASSTDQIYETFMNTALQKGISITKLQEPECIHIADGITESTGDLNATSSVFAKVLFPTSSTMFAYSKTSAPELMFQIKYGSTSVVFLGNATPKIQKFIAAQGTTTTDALIIWNNASPDNLAPQLMNRLLPTYLVYSKLLTASAGTSSKTASTSKKQKIDPLSYIPDKDRFNIKEFDYVKLTSDGRILRVEGVK